LRWVVCQICERRGRWIRTLAEIKHGP
jgi:hypothetical protein